jgi:hypothetical protein
VRLCCGKQRRELFRPSAPLGASSVLPLLWSCCCTRSIHRTFLRFFVLNLSSRQPPHIRAFRRRGPTNKRDAKMTIRMKKSRPRGPWRRRRRSVFAAPPPPSKQSAGVLRFSPNRCRPSPPSRRRRRRAALCAELGSRRRHPRRGKDPPPVGFQAAAVGGRPSGREPPPSARAASREPRVPFERPKTSGFGGSARFRRLAPERSSPTPCGVAARFESFFPSAASPLRRSWKRGTNSERSRRRPAPTRASGLIIRRRSQSKPDSCPSGRPSVVPHATTVSGGGGGGGDVDSASRPSVR